MMIINALYRFSKMLLIVFGILMVSVILLQIISRNVFHYSFIWAEELAKYLLVWTTFLGASVGLKDKELGAMDLLEEKLSQKLARWQKLLIEAMVAFFLIYLLYYSTKLLLKPSVYLQISASLRISMFYVYLALPISALLMIIYTFSNIVQLIRNRGGHS